MPSFSEVSKSDRIIVALDCSESEALRLADKLKGRAKWVKIGMTLYYAAGPRIVSAMKERGFNVFLDLKFFDIPHQVQGAAKSAVLAGADMITAHASGGVDMLRSVVLGANQATKERGCACLQAKNSDDEATKERERAFLQEKNSGESAQENNLATKNQKNQSLKHLPQNQHANSQNAPITLGITVLTSMDAPTLKSVGVSAPLDKQVSMLANLSLSSGLSGVVCSAQEAQTLRAQLGDSAYIVTPGIRPKWAAVNDQSRIVTPADAFSLGASHIVVGRPITAADDPLIAFDKIADEVN